MKPKLTFTKWFRFRPASISAGYDWATLCIRVLTPHSEYCTHSCFLNVTVISVGCKRLVWPKTDCAFCEHKYRYKTVYF